MKERPILFSGPMIRALLSGAKTMTRRTLKLRPSVAGLWGPMKDWIWSSETATKMLAGHSPYGQPGDRLWVRESFMPVPLEVPPSSPRPSRWSIAFAADGMQRDVIAPANYNPTLYNYERWTPSIFLPRWASRITLEVTGVRVERVQDISEEDARAEGALWHDGRGIGPSGWRHDIEDGVVWATARNSFQHLWRSINGAESWDANPWVWAISFRRVNS